MSRCGKRCARKRMSLSGGSLDGPVQGTAELRDAGLEEEGLVAQSASSMGF